MKYPQVVVCAFDEWVANQIRDLVAEQKWLLREVRLPSAALDLVREPRPAVLLIQADPTGDAAGPFGLLSEAHRNCPDVGTVVISDAKLGEDDRAAWTAAAFDLGARAVLFPPLTRPVVEDVVSGLMAAAIQRGS